MLTRIISYFFKPLYLFASSKRFRAFALLRFNYGSIKKYKPRTIKFSNFRIKVLDVPSFMDQYEAIFLNQCYWFKSSKTNPRIIDCGANIGLASLYFKSIFPDASIAAFEADPDISEILKSNLSSNNATDVEIINKAVWTDSKGISFQKEGGQGGRITQNINKDSLQTSSISLKEFLSHEEQVDFLKIDIEGAEFEVLSDSFDFLGKVQNLFVEYHVFREKENQLNDLLALVKKAGFNYFLQNNSLEKPFLQSTQKEIDYTVEIFAQRKS